MTMQYSRTQERHLPAPPELVWGLVADSNRWDRLVGFNPTRYRYTILEAEGEPVRARVGQTTQSWGETEWIERDQLEVRRFETELRGVSQRQACVAVLAHA